MSLAAPGHAAHTQSLVVQSPGAGPEVTAGGIFADLLRLASYLAGSA
jgi:homoserine dehydrogenase